MYTDASGNNRFYDNETDNYQQDHQLHWNEKVSTNWRTNLAFHYTKGKGYYENYKENGKFSDYGLTQLLVRRYNQQNRSSASKWLDNDFYGTNTFSAIYKVMAQAKLKIVIMTIMLLK
jgi:iron complex outermembrane receptor protein